MQLGMIGLGRMGANMVRRLMRGGHECVVWDVNPDNVKQLAGEGATGAESLDDFIGKLTQPRAVWIMVPAGNATEKTVTDLAARMDAGDIIIDGGNSYFKDDARRAIALRDQGHQLCRRGNQRRRVGIGARLLHDDRRAGRNLFAISIRSSKRWRPVAATLPARRDVKKLPARSKMAIFTAAHPAPAISSRWSTTESSTA